MITLYWDKVVLDILDTNILVTHINRLDESKEFKDLDKAFKEVVKYA